MKMPRFRQLDYQFESGCENCQQDERKRIAQELHDTLLQGFTGIALKLDALTTNLPPALSKTKQQLRQALEQMDHYLGKRAARFGICAQRRFRAPKICPRCF
jgi:signal transduction histidine kinase